jgi:hypothetical protein
MSISSVKHKYEMAPMWYRQRDHIPLIESVINVNAKNYDYLINWMLEFGSISDLDILLEDIRDELILGSTEISNQLSKTRSINKLNNTISSRYSHSNQRNWEPFPDGNNHRTQQLQSQRRKMTQIYFDREEEEE